MDETELKAEKKRRRRWVTITALVAVMVGVLTLWAAVKLSAARDPVQTFAVTPSEISTRVSAVDGMVQVYIPAGEFVMGVDANTKREFFNKGPVHKVYLDAYWMDRTEVTNAMYARCVQAGRCIFSVENATTPIHFHNPAYADHPVVYVKWESAVEYCRWAGRRLPTEAEWEKAARGTDERKYPWGNESPNASRSNFNDLVGDTTPVGKYLAGASPYGILDMAGNVREWVADWFSAQYYLNSPFENPLGPAKGQEKVLRGGSFKDGYAGVLATTRYSHDPGSAGMNRGFRCVSP